MSDPRVRACIALLNQVAGSHQIGRTAIELLRLLEYAKIVEKVYADTITVSMQVEAGKFWCKVLGMDVHLTNPSLHRSAIAYYSVVSEAARPDTRREFRAQALDYCSVITSITNQYLGLNERVPIVIPPPQSKIARRYKVVGGTALEKIVDEL